MLASSLRWHIHNATLKKLEHCLLHTLSRHISGDRRIVALTSDLIDLVDEHDSSLSSCNIIICLLEKTRENALHILTDITGLCEHSCINNSERHIQKAGYSLGHQCLTSTGRTNHQNV